MNHLFLGYPVSSRDETSASLNANATETAKTVGGSATAKNNCLVVYLLPLIFLHQAVKKEQHIFNIFNPELEQHIFTFGAQSPNRIVRVSP